MKIYRLGKKSKLAKALRDARTMTRLLWNNPTLLSIVIPRDPETIAFVDVSKEGVGGMMHMPRRNFMPMIFRVLFPKETHQILEV